MPTPSAPSVLPIASMTSDLELPSPVVSISGIALPDFASCLVEARAKLAEASDKSVVAVIGNTGSGKSTLVNILLGHRLEQVDTDDGEQVLRVVSQGRAAVMGNNIDACTLYPETFFDAESGFYFCDCPGFLDTRGKDKRILVEACLRMLPKKAREIKSLIIVLEHDMLYTEKAKGLDRLIENLRTVLSDAALTVDRDFKILKHSTIFVFNPKSSNKNLKQITARLTSLIEIEEARFRSFAERGAAGEKDPVFLEAERELKTKLALLQLMKAAVSLDRFVLLNSDKPDVTRNEILVCIREGPSFAKSLWEKCAPSSDYEGFIEQLLQLRLDSRLDAVSAPGKQAVKEFLLSEFDRIDYDESLFVRLCNAIRGDNEAGARVLLENRFLNLNQKDASGRTALLVAADYLSVRLFQILWQHPKTDVNAVDEQGRSFLHIAVSNEPDYKPARLLDILKMVIRQNRINFDRKDGSGRTALMIAREKGHSEEVIALLKTKARIDCNEELSRTLHTKAQEGDTDGLTALMSDQSVNANQKDSLGRTALLVAADFLRVESFGYLWDHPRVNVRARDNLGRTALHIALSNNPSYRPEQLLQIIRLISRSNKLNFDVKDNNAKTALMVARDKGHSEEIIALLKPRTSIDYDEALSKTLIEKVKAHDIGGLSRLLSNPMVNVNQAFQEFLGRTALLEAAYWVYQDSFQILWLRPDVNVRAVDVHRRTVLHLLLDNASNYRTDDLLGILRLVLSADRVDVDAKDNNGKTALMIAREKSHSAEVISLLRAKAKEDKIIGEVRNSAGVIIGTVEPYEPDDCCCTIM